MTLIKPTKRRPPLTLINPNDTPADVFYRELENLCDLEDAYEPDEGTPTIAFNESQVRALIDKLELQIKILKTFLK